MREMRSTETRSVILQKYSVVHGDPNSSFDTVISTLHRELNLDTSHPNINAFMLPSGPVVGNTYTLRLELDIAISRRLATGRFLTTSIATVLLERGIILHCLLGLEIDYIENSDSATRCSIYLFSNHIEI